MAVNVLIIWRLDLIISNNIYPNKDGLCRCVRMTTLPPSYAVVMKSGDLNFLEPSGPLLSCKGTALSLHFTCHCVVPDCTVRRADNLTTLMYRMPRNLSSSTTWNPLGLSRPLMELLRPFI